MQLSNYHVDKERYAKCIEVSKRVRWNIDDDDVQRIKDCVLRGYRWQYIFSGVEHPRFQTLYQELTTDDQRHRVSVALATLT